MKNDRKIRYDVKEKRGMSEKELKKLLKKWQKKLGMDDWKISLKIVDFKRKDFRQSGDFIADPKKKTASIFMTWNPYRDEEYTLVHELIHVLVYDYDKNSENLILKKSQKNLRNKRNYYKALF